MQTLHENMASIGQTTRFWMAHYSLLERSYVMTNDYDKLMSLFDRIGAASLVLPLHRSQYFIRRIVHSQLVTIITLPRTPRFPARFKEQEGEHVIVREGTVRELLLNPPPSGCEK